MIKMSQLNNNKLNMPRIVVMGPSKENLQDIAQHEEDMKNNQQKQEARRTSSVSHRKNSVSLPNLDDLKDLKEVKHQDTMVNSQSDLETDDELINRGGHSRNVRRKSVLSPRMLTPPEPGDFVESNSAANSITSVNSLASLLREKIQGLPQSIRKKKNNDYKIKVFVVFLFITIVVLVCCAYFLYNQKVLAKAYFERIKLNKNKRLMKILNDDGVEILNARIGTTLNDDKVMPCLEQDEQDSGSICFEWMDRARLYLSFYFLQGEIKCYNLKWISLNDGIFPTDCFEMNSGVHWYGGGQNKESAWPLEKGSHDFAPFVTGNVERHEWGNVLSRYFINSKGSALIIDDKTPLYLSIRNSSTKNEFCLSARYDNFAFVNKFTITPELNYSICVGNNMSELHLKLSENTLWDGLKKEDADVMDTLLTQPVWEITTNQREALTEETLSNFTSGILNLRLSTIKPGHVLINEFWQNQVGDFEVDVNRFPDFENTMVVLGRRGFRVVFTVQPFISTESFNFLEAVERKLLILERFSGRIVPALTSFKTVQTAGMLDITNNKTVPWLVTKLKNVMEKYKFNATFFLELGTAYDMPHYYQCEKPLENPDQYKSIFVNSLQNFVGLMGVSDAIKRPRPPTFVSLPRFESSWDGLRRLIPTVLTYGIIGYPFLIPGVVGGDYSSTDDEISKLNGTFTDLEYQELYIRWLQLSTFLPVIKYNRLPSTYENDKVLFDTLARLRYDKVNPVLRKYAKVSLNIGLPIIRPLWMIDPYDPSCQTVIDEFAVGEDIIVAPILYPGAKTREVYLPAGLWKDGIDGSLRKGRSWIHDHRVELHKVAYFERMPDNTRQ